MILGADLSSAKLAFVMRGPGGPLMRAVKLPGQQIPPRILSAYNATHAFIADCANLHIDHFAGKPMYAFVEAPVVAGARNLQTTIKQSLVSGGVQTALLEWEFQVYLVPVKSWKKVVVGSGNAKKEHVGPAIERHWRDAAYVADGDQDLLDATGLCLYGEHICRRAATPLGL